jgi:hypothetical protein
METLTSGDYTVEIRVEEIYKAYNSNKLNTGERDANFMSAMFEFKHFFLDWLSNKLLNMEPVFVENKDLWKERI